MQKYRINIVVVSYNSKSSIEHTLNPLIRMVDEGIAHIIVVDNHGTDGVREIISRYNSKVKYLYSGGNIGFGAACNLGYLQVSSEYTLFLNPDAVLDETNLNKLVHFLDDNRDVAITGPCIESDSEFQTSGNMLLPSLWQIKKYHGFVAESRIIKPNDEPYRTNWICGAILLIRSDIFEEVGGFDSNFFLYFEETDLCYRVMLAGYQIYANGTSISQHIGGASSIGDTSNYIHGCIAEHFYESRYYFISKHYGLSAALLTELHTAIKLITHAFKNLLKFKNNPFNEIIARFSATFFNTPKQANNFLVRGLTKKATHRINTILKISLTFDDAPSINEQNIKFDPSRMIKVIRVLKQNNIKHCVAFVVGEQAEAHKDILTEWLEAGYQLGNHTYNHESCSSLSLEQFEKTLSDCDNLLNSINAFEEGSTKWFRFPFLDYGINDIQRARFNKIIHDYGYKVAHSSLRFNDEKFEQLLQNQINSRLGKQRVIEQYIHSAVKKFIKIKKFGDYNGSDMKHIIYSHFGQVNENTLPLLLEKLSLEGVDWISLEEASESDLYSDFALLGESSGLVFKPHYVYGKMYRLAKQISRIKEKIKF